ncbi:MAG TPA: undecaprenyl-diphosphate phosphatase [Magnetospirillaceae bacterium]|nr:undecaprenyl-diphosphate phosphatase [Magnetospirillaceae bacterium]
MADMSSIEGVLLGAVQGVTEFIPVSSSGHLVVAQHFLGLPASPTFDSLINLGTFLALVIYFRKRLWDITVRLFTKRETRLIRNIAISAAPVLAVGFLLKSLIESPVVQSAWVVVGTLVFVGFIMIVLERLPRASTVASYESLSPKRALAVGLAQMCALIPGVSRSGSSIIAGRLAGLSYAKAAEYSFLLSIPVMFAVVVLGFAGHEGRDFIANNFWLWLTSNIAAFTFGIIAVGFMLRFLSKGNLVGFGWYRIGLAFVVIAVLVTVG